VVRNAYRIKKNSERIELDRILHNFSFVFLMSFNIVICTPCASLVISAIIHSQINMLFVMLTDRNR